MNANSVAQLMMRGISGNQTYMYNTIHRPNSLTNGSVTPTQSIEDRIRGILTARRVDRDDDPYDLKALEPTGDEFPANARISYERDGADVLEMQEAHDAAIQAENGIHASDGLPGFGADALPCRLVDHTPGRTR